MTSPTVSETYPQIHQKAHQQELGHVIINVYDIAGFPSVIGAVYGKHIRIKSPSTDEHL